MTKGIHMGYRDCFPRFPLPPGQPDQLLSELHEAQNALAIVEHYVYSSVAHESLHEARNIIDRVIEMLRIEVAGPIADQTTRDE